MLIQFKYILIDYKHQAFLQCSSVLGGLYSESVSCSIVVQRFWVKARVGTLKFRGDRHQQLNVWLIGAFYTLFYCTTVSDKSWEVKEKHCGCSKTRHSRAKDCQQQPNVLVKPPLALSTSIYFVTLVILLYAAQGNSAVKSQEKGGTNRDQRRYSWIWEGVGGLWRDLAAQVWLTKGGIVGKD